MSAVSYHFHTGCADAIPANEHFALMMWALAGVVAVVLGLVLHQRKLSMLGVIPMIAAAVMHPAWWMSSTRGDCGDGLHTLAMYYTASVAALAGVIYWLTARR